jgi:hypothetical protein
VFRVRGPAPLTCRCYEIGLGLLDVVPKFARLRLRCGTAQVVLPDADQLVNRVGFGWGFHNQPFFRFGASRVAGFPFRDHRLLGRVKMGVEVDKESAALRRFSSEAGGVAGKTLVGQRVRGYRAASVDGAG